MLRNWINTVPDQNDLQEFYEEPNIDNSKRSW
jgi:hypothetical protein